MRSAGTHAWRFFQQLQVREVVCGIHWPVFPLIVCVGIIFADPRLIVACSNVSFYSSSGRDWDSDA
jgi:hypothetical protein